MRRALLVLFFVGMAGCTITTAPPLPPPPPVSAPNTCAAECARIVALSCMPVSQSCESDCISNDAERTQLGLATHDHACIAIAASCDAMNACL